MCGNSRLNRNRYGGKTEMIFHVVVVVVVGVAVIVVVVVVVVTPT